MYCNAKVFAFSGYPSAAPSLAPHHGFPVHMHVLYIHTDKESAKTTKHSDSNKERHTSVYDRYPRRVKCFKRKRSVHSCFLWQKNEDKTFSFIPANM